jgi:hypothetical protein
VWKGHGPKDEFDDQWATRAWTSAITKEMQVDEGVHMEEILFQHEPMA